MTLQDELALSYYRDLGPLDGSRRADSGEGEDGGKENSDAPTLLMHQPTGKVCVKKTLRQYNRGVYELLKAQPVAGTPRILEVMEEDGRLTVIEEYLSGITLEQRLTEGVLESGKALEYMDQLCAIVEGLHALTPPVIHRDIKPSNILITQEERLYLCDFDAARFAAEETTGQTPCKDTVLMGTVGYAAPEQYGFSASNERTDVYALGVVYHEMLTGKPLGEAGADEVHGRAGRIIRKCTEMDPEKRYSSVRKLRLALGGKAGAPWYLLPGYRTGTWWHVALMTLYYVIWIWFAYGIGKSYEGLWRQLANGGLILLVGLAVPFTMGNYLDIWERLGINRLSERWMRYLAALALTALKILIIFMLGGILQKL